MRRAWLAIAQLLFLCAATSATAETSEAVQQELIRAVASGNHARVESLARERKRRLTRRLREGEFWNPVFFRIVERASPEALAAFLGDEDYRDARNNWGWNWLQYAISRKATPVYRALVDSGIDLKHRDSAGYAALHHAALRGDREAAQVLLEKGVPVDVRAATDETPLMIAVASTRPGVVELLLASGANVTLQDRNGDSALHFAVRTGNRPLLRLLVARGGSLDLPARNGWTPRQELALWFPGLPEVGGR
jgi:ankyrin repeat protein